MNWKYTESKEKDKMVDEMNNARDMRVWYHVNAVISCLKKYFVWECNIVFYFGEEIY